jgi:hypothetical protein
MSNINKSTKLSTCHRQRGGAFDRGSNTTMDNSIDLACLECHDSGAIEGGSWHTVHELTVHNSNNKAAKRRQRVVPTLVFRAHLHATETAN